MALPNNHPLHSRYLTAYTPSCGTTPVAAYVRCPTSGTIRGFSGILGGAITTANGTITLVNVTTGSTIGTFTVIQSGSAAGQLFSGSPSTTAVSGVTEDDVISITPSAASGTTIPMHFQITIRNSQ